MISAIASARVRWCLKRLSSPSLKQEQRFETYRLAMSALQDAWDCEVRQVDELNSVKADPNIEALTGSPVV